MTNATLTDKKLPFHIGRVFRNTFLQFGRYFWLILLEIVVIAIALSGMFVLLSFLSQMDITPQLYIYSRSLVGKISSTFFSAIIIAIILHDMNQHPLKIGEVIRLGAKRYFPLLAVSILETVAVSFGMVLLIVPGVIVALMWFVAGAACVGEQLGPIESLKRSQTLTKGYRWQLLAIFVIVVACSIVISQAIVQFMPKTALFSVHSIALPAAIVLSHAWAGISYAFAATLTATVFHELRTIKESMPVATAVSVFE